MAVTTHVPSRGLTPTAAASSGAAAGAWCCCSRRCCLRPSLLLAASGAAARRGRRPGGGARVANRGVSPTAGLSEHDERGPIRGRCMRIGAPYTIAGPRSRCVDLTPQRMRPVSCMNRNSVAMESTVTVSPVNPSQK